MLDVRILRKVISWAIPAFFIVFISDCASGPEEIPSGKIGITTGDILIQEKNELSGLYLKLGETYYLDLSDHIRARYYYMKYLDLIPEGEGVDLARRRLRELAEIESLKEPYPPSGGASSE